MTRDEIIEMAREVGMPETEVEGVFRVNSDDLGHFSHLIQQHLIQQGYRQCAVGQRTTQHCGQLEQAVAAEREACASLCEEIEENCWETWDSLADPQDQGSAIGAAHCAAAIRARGEK